MNHLHLSNLLHLPQLAHIFTLGPHQTHQPADAASVTLPPCLKSLIVSSSCPNPDTIFPSASPFTGLEELLMSNCSELTSLPDPIGDVLPCLRKLTIRYCFSLDRLPESFTSLSRLEALDVSDSHTFTLPSNFGHLPALKLLVLKWLSLTELPLSFSHLTSLEALSVENCRYFRQLPAGFCRLTALKALCLPIRELPEEIGALAVPSRLDTLTGLKRLELFACLQLSELPAALPPSLETLTLGTFKEGSSPFVDISQLSQLRVLKLKDVGVRCGPEVSGRFACLQQLEQLEICWQIDTQELPVPLTFLPRLRSLLIDAPRLCSLPDKMEAALPQLRHLELLSWSQEELPRSIMELLTLTSLAINAPRLVLLPQGMIRLTRLRKRWQAELEWVRLFCPRSSCFSIFSFISFSPLPFDFFTLTRPVLFPLGSTVLFVPTAPNLCFSHPFLVHSPPPHLSFPRVQVPTLASHFCLPSAFLPHFPFSFRLASFVP
ncbi:unnamed protein product, partial [Closterium sp. Naga37s-1]